MIISVQIINLSVKTRQIVSQFNIVHHTDNVIDDKFVYVDWAHASDIDIQNYSAVLDSKLMQLNVPNSILCSDNCNNHQHLQLIDVYFNSIMGCIQSTLHRLLVLLKNWV